MAKPPGTQVLLYVVVGLAILIVGAGALRDGGHGGGLEAADAVRAGAGAMISSPGDAGGQDGSELQISHAGGTPIVVHVAGEVRDPGLYRLALGARVGAAIRSAGGETRGAMLDAINLAARLTDGQQVVVPARSAAAAGPAAAGPSSGAAAPDAPISLGTATVEQLETIDGVGPVTAGKIVEFRDSRGGLGSVDELVEVHGIGPATVDRLRDSLSP